MKPCNFSYVRPATIAEAAQLLQRGEGMAKVMAGGQSLGPMLNLRLAQPDMLVDITEIPETTQVRQEQDAIFYGACITHAAFEDRRVPDPVNGFLGDVAGGIAYRAVRNRGTIGGSLAHADPAADWVTVLTALGAELCVNGPDGERRVGLDNFMTTAFSTTLADVEFVTAVRIPRYSARAKAGYFKFCRKKGEFAEAMAAVVFDPEHGRLRAVIGATDTKPVILDDIDDIVFGDGLLEARLDLARQRVFALGIADDPIKENMHANALARALGQILT